MFNGWIKGDFPYSTQSLKTGINAVRHKLGDQRISERRRIDLLVKACGLEATFTPKVVLENLRKDSDGNMISVASGRDGRVLWSGKTKKTPHLKEGDFKFSTPWKSTDPSVKRKAAKFSYLVKCLARHGLSERGVKPLSRLCIQFLKLKWLDFKGLISKVLSLAVSRVVKVDSPLRLIGSQSKPSLLEKRFVGGILHTVHLWTWRPKGR